VLELFCTIETESSFTVEVRQEETLNADVFLSANFVDPTIRIVAHEIIPKFRFVNSLGMLADSHSALFIDADAVGIQAGEDSTALLDEAIVTYEGEITNAAWNFTPLAPVFLGADGQAISTVPVRGSTVWNVLLGVALSATTLRLDIQRPIRL